jgi:hypothetical protein
MVARVGLAVKAHDVLEPSSVPVYKHIRGCLHLHVSVLCQDSLCSNGNSMLAGRQFFAHRIALLASSDAFRAMFESGYRVDFITCCWTYELTCFLSMVTCLVICRSFPS